MRKLNGIIASLRSISESSEYVGDQDGAEGPLSGEDRLDAFIDNMMDAVLEEYEEDEDVIQDVIIDVLEEMSSDGVLPPLPDEATDDDYYLFVEAAEKSAGVKEAILNRMADSD